MIKNIFPVNIYTKDLNVDETWSKELENISKSIFLSYLAEKNITRKDITENEIPFFTKSNIEQYPIIKELQDIFIEGFYSLASSYDNNTLSQDDIEKMVCSNTGRLPFMEKYDYKPVHSHLNSSAFAIFYLTDVNNEKDGGKLILRDPSFNVIPNFRPKEKYEIETKKNRLIVVPAYVWHEVTPYFADEERLTIVINLDFSVEKYDKK
jgi:hypothetical protein